MPSNNTDRDIEELAIDERNPESIFIEYEEEYAHELTMGMLTAKQLRQLAIDLENDE